MAGPLRKSFHDALDDIDGRVIQLFALVSESLAAATQAFLAGERSSGREASARDDLIDSLYSNVERLVEHHMLVQAPVASEFRYLLSVLRIVPELERSGDLAEHIAQRAARGLGGEVPPAVRGLVEQMGTVAATMWRAAAEAYADRDPAAAERLDKIDDELDDLHTRLTAQLMSGTVELAAALEMALVARFYERLGDHALHITERFVYLAGKPPE
ncbi:MAG: phosphate signaling complex PhoU family protein [Acidimicrobiia bacterium]